MTKSYYLEDKELLYPTKHKKVLDSLLKLNKTELGKALSIKDNILNNTSNQIKSYGTQEKYHAFPSFTGLVFINLDKESFKEEEYDYIAKNIRVLDAFYGVLEPGTLIKRYRLDMKAKIDLNLYKHWNVDDYFTDDLIINLASKEFSKMLNKEVINIHFLQNKNGKFINQATYTKMARGKFLSYLVTNKIENVEEMKSFIEDHYQFNESLSDELNITFTR
jgi:cytoplasmic iron level regulating protein YaaA (DUF328/UPF0246 family)